MMFRGVTPSPDAAVNRLFQFGMRHDSEKPLEFHPKH